MEEFDRKIKSEVNNHLRNINMTQSEKEKINKKMVQSKKYGKVIPYTLSSVVLVASFILILNLSIFGKSESDLVRKTATVSFSELEMNTKEGLPQGFYNGDVDKEQEQVKEDVAPIVEEPKAENEDVAPIVEEPKAENEDVAPIVEEPKTENGDVVPIVEESKVINEDLETIFFELALRYDQMSNTVTNQVNYNIASDEIGGYQFKSYTSKEEVYNLLSDFMVRDAASRLWDDSLVLLNGKLYLRAICGKLGFYADIPYEIIKISDVEFKMLQDHNTGGLFGSLKLEIFFTKFEDKWLISDVKFIVK